MANSFLSSCDYHCGDKDRMNTQHLDKCVLKHQPLASHINTTKQTQRALSIRQSNKGSWFFFLGVTVMLFVIYIVESE